MIDETLDFSAFRFKVLREQIGEELIDCMLDSYSCLVRHLNLTNKSSRLIKLDEETYSLSVLESQTRKDYKKGAPVRITGIDLDLDEMTVVSPGPFLSLNPVFSWKVD